MKSLTQIIGAIVLSSFLSSCNNPLEPPQLKNWSFVSKYDGAIKVDYLEYYKSIKEFEREIMAFLYLRPQDAEFSEDYPKVVMDIYSKGNTSVRTFVDYGYSNDSTIVDEYWDGKQFVKRIGNEEEFKQHDKEYLQLLDLINFRAQIAKRKGDYPR